MWGRQQKLSGVAAPACKLNLAADTWKPCIARRACGHRRNSPAKRFWHAREPGLLCEGSLTGAQPLPREPSSPKIDSWQPGAGPTGVMATGARTGLRHELGKAHANDVR